MLALKLGISLPSLPPLRWSPSEETTLVAWYQNRTGLTLVGGGLEPPVSAWADSSGNGYDMVQATSSERPVYEVSTGELSFVSANIQNLQTSGTQISLTGDFTIGLKITTSTTNGAFLADNTTANEFFKYSGASRIALKIAGSSSTNLDLDSGTFGDDFIIITRASDILKLWHNGVVQTGTTPTLAGTSLIDVIGLRRTDGNAFDGQIAEIQIYSSSSTDLTTKVNNRLKHL
jgi:hypothetical protein